MDIYLDNSATTRPYKMVVEKVADTMSNFYGNPSSLHRKGIEAEKIIKTARKQIADTIGAVPNEIIFTSGGTEADNLAIMGICDANRGRQIIATPLEHPAIGNTLRTMEKSGYHVDFIPVNASGVVDLEAFEKLISDDTVLVTSMFVNNEVGTIEPIEKMVKILKKKKPEAYFHVDAVQAYCKVPINVNNLDVDLISISSHKVHGPNGIGALYVKSGVKLGAISFGGGQEKGIRPGTEDVASIAGFGVAAQHCNQKMPTSIPQIIKLRKRLENGIISKIENVQINTPINPAPQILNVSFGGVKSEVLLHSLEIDNIYVSSGSACSSHKREPSHVLTALGVERKMIDGSIRFSLSEFTTEDEIDKTIESLARIVKRLRKLNLG
ncbi:MAG: cysteine desulfurase family protein [Oscillospiraceae bacterium]